MASLLLPLWMNVAVANSQHSFSENPYARKHLNLTYSNWHPLASQSQYTHKPLNSPRYQVNQVQRDEPKNPYVTRSLRFSSFDAVEVIGNIDVDIDGGAYDQQVEVSGSPKNVRAVVAYTKGRTVYISTLAQSQGQRPKLSIHASRLSQFNYRKGGANITIQKLSPYYPMCINIQGCPKVAINGNIRLRRLIVGGESQVSVFWINSCDFYLRVMNKANVCLAGVVKTFEADTFQSARANARYLHAERVFVKSYDCSRADVRASCALNALATGFSTIYSYQDPNFQAPFMQCAGSVVQMTNICCPPNGICDEACCKNGWH